MANRGRPGVSRAHRQELWRYGLVDCKYCGGEVPYGEGPRPRRKLGYAPYCRKHERLVTVASKRGLEVEDLEGLDTDACGSCRSTNYLAAYVVEGRPVAMLCCDCRKAAELSGDSPTWLRRLANFLEEASGD